MSAGNIGFLIGLVTGVTIMGCALYAVINDEDQPLVNVRLLGNAFMPVRAHPTDAGIDLITPETFTVPSHGFATVDTGVCIELPRRTRGHVCSRSGLNRDHGITADGTVDEGYTGSVGVTLHNDGDHDYTFERGDKVAQLVIERVMYPKPVIATWISGGERQDGGFGSTGR